MRSAPLAITALHAADTKPRGAVALPTLATVFGPFAREDGVPAPELLSRVPTELVVGNKRGPGRPASFDA